MKTTIKTKAMSILLVIVMLLGMIPMSVLAADTKPSYVALGDSISTGYGLADKTAQGFAYLLADSLGYELTNLAVDGNTAAGILAQLSDEAVQTAVAGAELITVTAGGNDLMALLYQAIADQYNAAQSNNADWISASEVTAIMADSSDGRRLFILNYALNLLNPDSNIYLLDDQTFINAITAYIDTLNRVMSTIRALNANAAVIVSTQYNPYAEFNGASMTGFLPISLTPVYAGMEAGVTALNTAILYNAAIGGYIVADVKAAFDDEFLDEETSATNDLYVADPVSLEFDFHPNAAGHKVFADTMIAAVPSTDEGEETCDHGGNTNEYIGSGDGKHAFTCSVCLATVTDDCTLTYSASDNTVTAACSECEAQLGSVVITAEDKTYDGMAAAAAVTATGVFEAIDLSIAYVSNDTVTDPVNAGTYTASITYGDVKASVEFTIHAADPLFNTPTANTLTYNGTEQALVSSSSATGGEIQYSLNNSTWSETVPACKDAGEYTVYFKVVGDSNHNDNEGGKITVTISRAQVTVTADDKTASIGDSMPELTYEAVGLFGDDTVSVELTCDADMSAEGETPIVVTASDANGNYEITAVNGTLTVTDPSSSDETTYTVTVNSGDNGNAVAAPDTPKEGETVTVTPTPDAGYEVDEVTAADMNGDPVAVVDNGDGTYSFLQPSGIVTVTVTFAEIDEAEVICPGDSTCPMYGYTDLDLTTWYHDGIHFCIENGLMAGTADDTFAPGMTTSRAMIVTILWRLAGKPVVDYEMSFEDVAADTWYTEAVRWAQANNIVSGYNTEAFGPDDVITREQLATILYRYEQYKGGGFTGAWMLRMDYVDLADVSDWAYEAMCWMNMNGIVNGKPGKLLDPKGSATRAEAATVLYRYCDVSDKDN